ncbi:type I methionyl aminopeptidase [soil metagenome]|jgi:methionyl aminopeptidase
MVTRKSPAEIALMAAAGRVLAAVHELLVGVAQPGVTTGELDRIAEQEIRGCGALPSFKGYRGYPATLNTSINDQIVHAIPSDDVTLRAGDVLSVDGGVLLDGYHADSAWTCVVGGPDTACAAVADLVEDTREAMWRGITTLVVGNRLGDVSAAIGEFGSACGYGVIAEHNGHALGGHGIGRQLHEDPLVLNHGRRGRGMRLRPGLVFAIEPMFTLGAPAWRTMNDGWTTETLDGRIAAHWEHTVAVTEDGPVVLTARADEAQRAAALIAC